MIASEVRKDPRFKNHGKTWTVEHESLLLAMVVDGCSIETIGLILRRRNESACVRLCKILRKCGEHKLTVIKFLEDVDKGVFNYESHKYFSSGQYFKRQ